MERNVQGWLVVAVGFVTLATIYTAWSSLGLAMPLWESEFGWSRSVGSGTGALFQVMYALVAPIAGNLVDRHGPRYFFSSGLLLFGIALFATTTISLPWHPLLAFSIAGGLGYGAVGMHVVSTGVAGFFTERRGLAIGVATAGATAGQLVLVPLVGLVVGNAGWRMGFAMMGTLACLLAPVAFWLLRAGSRLRPPSSARPEPLGLRLATLARDPVFRALLATYVVCGFTTSGVIEVHLLPYAAACGFTPQASTLAYGILSAVNLGGMVLAGYLADRMHRPLLLGIIYSARALAFLILMTIVDDYALLIVFAVVFGLFDYATVPVTASLIASHLGMRLMGLAFGLLSAGHALGAAARGVLRRGALRNVR